MTNIKGILLISKSGFELYVHGLPSPARFVYPQNTFAYFELTNVEQYETALKQFIQTNKIPPAQLLFIAQKELVFEKLVVTKDPLNQKEEVDKVIDKIPFETVLSKTVPEQNGIRVIALNGTFFNAIAVSFEKSGFSCLGIQIDSQISATLVSKKTLDGLEIEYIYKNIELLQKNSFPCLTTQEEDSTTYIPLPGESENKPKSRLPILIGVFVFLIAILAFVLLRQ